MAEAPLAVEVVWIGATPPMRVAFAVPAGTTVAEALASCDVAARIAAHPDAPPGARPLDGLAVALHGRLVPPGEVLHDGDRIELLPPLTVDPKVARQRRADHRRRERGERRWAPDREHEPAPRTGD